MLIWAFSTLPNIGVLLVPHPLDLAQYVSLEYIRLQPNLVVILAVLAEQHGEWAESRRYLGLDALTESQAVSTDLPAEVTPDLHALSASPTEGSQRFTYATQKDLTGTLPLGSPHIREEPFRRCCVRQRLAGLVRVRVPRLPKVS